MKRLEYLLKNCSVFRIQVCDTYPETTYMLEYEIRSGRKRIGSETCRHINLSEAVEEAYKDVLSQKGE